MQQQALQKAATDFKLWAEQVENGIWFDTKDVGLAVSNLSTAVKSDGFPLPVLQEQIVKSLHQGLSGNLRAAQEFAQTINGYVTTAVKLEDDGQTSVWIMDDNDIFEDNLDAYCTHVVDRNAFIIASMQLMSDRCTSFARQLERQSEVKADLPEPGM